MWSVNNINHIISRGNKNVVVIDAATQLGYDIPRFCYHEGLKIAGNCRMCLIEDTKAAKPVVSCAMTLTPDLDIFTNTVRVKKARESVMEFLLINHPLDCPICDQGGECDLQDLSVIYGSDHGRFYEYKRNVEDKNCGPIVKTVMNRCILCTRCVRFATDIANYSSFGITGRGMKSEIGSYVEKIVDTDLSGNLVDVCPVGALTSKPYAFAARPWELKRLTTLNVLDDDIQIIRVDIKENELLRILPAKNDTLINSWITNRVRFSYEGLTRARQSTPSVKGAPLSWAATIKTITTCLNYILNKYRVGSKNIITVYEETLSNEDWVSIKNTSAKAQLSIKHSVLVNAPLLNRRLVDKNLCTPWVLAVDLDYVSPLLSIQMKQSSEISVIWGNRTSNKTAIRVKSGICDLVAALKSKTWHSLITKAPLLLSDPILLHKIGQILGIRYSALINSASARGRNFLFPAKTFANVSPIINLEYALGEEPFISSSSPRTAEATLKLQQSSHNIVPEVPVFLPVATVYEQSKKTYFTANYTLIRTSRAVATKHKTNTSVLGVVTSSLAKANDRREVEDCFMFSNYSVAPETPYSLHLQPLNMYSIAVQFPFIGKNEYYNQYSLTKYSPTLSYNNTKNNKNIYD